MNQVSRELIVSALVLAAGAAFVVIKVKGWNGGDEKPADPARVERSAVADVPSNYRALLEGTIARLAPASTSHKIHDPEGDQVFFTFNDGVRVYAFRARFARGEFVGLRDVLTGEERRL